MAAEQAPALLSLRDIEERFAGRALAWTGGLALIAAAIFFLSLAFSRGWIGQELRVVIGLAVGGIAVAGGGWFLGRAERLLGTVLSGVGAGIISISLFAATRGYDLVPPELGLAAALLVAIVAASIALRTDAPVVAVFGLVAALAAPPLVGAPANLLTLGFVGGTLVGTTAIALRRSWRWLPLLGFLLSAPQLASWLNAEPSATLALTALVGFWLLNVVAAAGEEVRVRRDDLRGSSTTLVVLNVLFLVWGGFTVLADDLAVGRGLFLVAMALAHLGLAGWFFARQGQSHGFANLLAGTGAALVALAAPVQLGAPMVPVAWAAEAVVLTWLGSMRRHWLSLAGAAVLAILSVCHLVLLEYPTISSGTAHFGTPFLHPEAATLAFVVGALLVAAAIVPVRNIRSVVAAVAVLVTAYAMPLELSGAAMTGALVALLPIAVLLEIGVSRVPEDAGAAAWLIGLLVGTTVDAVPAPRTRVPFVTAAGAIALLVAVADALLHGLALSDWGLVSPPAVPFSDERAVLGGLLVGGALIWAVLATGNERRLALVGAAVMAGYLVPFEVYADGVVVLWCGLALAALLAPRLDRPGAAWFEAIAVTFVILALAAVFGAVVPPTRLVVVAIREAPGLLPGWALALAALAGVLAAVGESELLRPFRAWLRVAAGAVVVYLASVGVVGTFQGAVGGGVATEELAKQAQVALSVMWTLIGAGGFVIGLVRRLALVREAALALLALATAKVFLVDLSSLDVAYRALSFAGLGLLLLLSAYFTTRFRSPRPGSSGRQGDDQQPVA